MSKGLPTHLLYLSSIPHVPPPTTPYLPTSESIRLKGRLTSFETKTKQTKFTNVSKINDRNVVLFDWFTTPTNNR